MIARVYKYGSAYKVVWFKYGIREEVATAALLAAEGAHNTEGEKCDCNIYRARSRILELARCNPWEYFVTLTLNEARQDRYDLGGYVKDLGNWVGNFNKKYGCKLKYLLIPEPHKDGAWHMHGLMNDIPAAALVRNVHGYLDLPDYQRRFGWISLDTVKDPVKVSSYITKYVSKDLAARREDFGAHLFYASRGLSGKEVIGDTGTLRVFEGAFESDYTVSKWLTTPEEVAAALASLS